jgi:5-methyltetrahydrofolate--homocysteine methyltransferase
MTKQEFQKLTETGIVLLDGATGSNLRKAGMPVGVSTELWALEHPEIIRELQKAYVEAGSQIIYAPTFSANRISLAMHGLEDRLEELNTSLVALSKEAAGGHALVAGDVTTTGKMLEPKGEMAYETLYEVYQQQIRVLAEAGADLIVAETMLAVDETTVVLDAAASVCDLPVMCSLTLEADGSLLYGGTITEAVETLQEMGAAAVGLNCSVGPDQLTAVVSSIKKVAHIPVLVKPNAGMPVMDKRGMAHYNMQPDTFAECMQPLIEAGANLVGGCCGTDPEYIRALAKSLAALSR